MSRSRWRACSRRIRSGPSFRRICRRRSRAFFAAVSRRIPSDVSAASAMRASSSTKRNQRRDDGARSAGAGARPVATAHACGLHWWALPSPPRLRPQCGRGATAAPAPGGLERFSILAPPGDQIYPDSVSVAISPDGTMVAFVVGTVSRSETQLWVRSLDSLVARRLEGGDGATLVFWSPDSRRIGFLTNGKLKTIARSGGRADVLADTPGPRGGVWTPSNEIIFAPDAGGPLFKVSTNGGQPTPVTKIDPARKEYSHRFPALLPDGRHFLYASLPGKGGRFDIFAGSLDDPSQRTLVGSMEAAPIYAEPGWLLYARQGVLVAVPFDARALKITGDPIPLEDEPASILDPSVSYTAGSSVSVSPTGALAYYSAPSREYGRDMVQRERRADRFAQRPGRTLRIRRDLARRHAGGDGEIDVAVRVEPLAGRPRARRRRPVVHRPRRNDSPVWSPDGSRVVWAADREGAQNLYIKNRERRDAGVAALCLRRRVQGADGMVSRRQVVVMVQTRSRHGAEPVAAGRFRQETTDDPGARTDARIAAAPCRSTASGCLSPPTTAAGSSCSCSRFRRPAEERRCLKKAVS